MLSERHSGAQSEGRVRGHSTTWKNGGAAFPVQDAAVHVATLQHELATTRRVRDIGRGGAQIRKYMIDWHLISRGTSAGVRPRC
jgi:hypothetical protein